MNTALLSTVLTPEEGSESQAHQRGDVLASMYYVFPVGSFHPTPLVGVHGVTSYVQLALLSPGMAEGLQHPSLGSPIHGETNFAEGFVSLYSDT